MSLLIFDPFAGISGDMTIAALLDLGLDETWLRDFVRHLDIAPVTVHIERVDRRGITAPHIRFEYPHEHAHRHLRHIVEIIDAANADDRVRELAKDAFARIAAAEARIHGTTIEKVHFHEVGATDAILDILCSMAGVVQLGFSDFRTRPVALGSGSVDIEHGTFPVPAPATLEILSGIAVTGTDIPGECTTPTGAAILATLTNGRPAPDTFVPRRSGFGAGSRNPERRPNVLRLIAADASETPGEALWLLQADLDDLAPEYAAAAQSALLDAGALDAVLVPVGMKKGRLGTRLEVLATEGRIAGLERLVFQATSTIGVRRWRVERSALPREEEETEWRGHRIRWKRVVLPDGTSRRKPEYEDVAAAARALGLTPYEVRSRLGERVGTDGHQSGAGGV